MKVRNLPYPFLRGQPLNAFSVLGIPTGDTQNTGDLGTGVPKSL